MRLSQSKVARRLNERLGRHLGFELKRSTPETLLHELPDPRSVEYLSHSDRKVHYFTASLARASCFQFGLGPDSLHPWVVAVRRGLEMGDRSEVRRTLAAYHSRVVPASASDWLDLPTGRSSAFASLPPYAATFPWGSLDPQSEVDRQERIHQRENKDWNVDEGLSAGAKYFGYISAAKLDVETDRLWALAESISRVGLVAERDDYTLSGDFLLDGDEYHALVKGGCHRAAVAAAVGLKEIPLKVSLLVRREEASIWPQVVSGLFDESTALEVFDRLIAGNPPAVAQPWITFLGL